MNGKTLGRTKPAPDRSVVEETIRGHEEVQADIASGRELMTSRERSLHRDNIDLKRQLDVERNRVAVLMANGGKASIDGGIMTAKERNDEFERRILAIGEMHFPAQVEAMAKLVEDVKAAQEQRSKWLKDIDANTSKRVDVGTIVPRTLWAK